MRHTERTQGFIAGSLAGIVSAVLLYALSAARITVFIPELGVNSFVSIIPGSIESFFVTQMGELAKITAFITAIALFVLLHGIYGLLLPDIEKRFPSRTVVVAIFAGLAAGMNLFILLPLFGGGLLGVGTTSGVALTVVGVVSSSLIYGVMLWYVHLDLARSYPEGISVSRRTFLKTGVVVVVGLGLLFYGLDRFVFGPTRAGFASIADLFANDVTSNDGFYVVTKNLTDPVVDSASWSLSVDGLVAKQLQFSYDELTAMSMVDEYVTLQCVSNEIGGNLISNAKWTGIRLADLLAAAGVESTAEYCVFWCVDGYSVGVPLNEAQNPSSLLALEMNGEKLPAKHGFPARVVVPGLYGMFNAKWVNRISLVAAEYNGFWQEKGWTNAGKIKTVAFLRVPDTGSVHGSVIAVGGLAFAGDRGISNVQVSTDSGSTWNAAELRSPLSSYSWVLWSYAWKPTQTGSYKILARAVDGNGVPQDPSVLPPFPNGASGYDSIDVFVSSLS